MDAVRLHHRLEMTVARGNLFGRPRPAAAGMAFAITGLVLAGACSGPAGGTGVNSPGAKALSHLSPFEKRALKDKVVTVAELVTSTQVYVECLTKQGIGYDRDPANLGPSGIQLSIQVPPEVKSPDSYAAAVSDKAARCRDEVAAVEDVWVLQHQASKAEIGKAQATFVSCLRKAGLRLAANATFTDAGAAARAFLQDASSGVVGPNTERGRQLSAVSDCMASIATSSQTALPGLREALADLDTSHW